MHDSWRNRHVNFRATNAYTNAQSKLTHSEISVGQFHGNARLTGVIVGLFYLCFIVVCVYCNFLIFYLPKWMPKLTKGSPFAEGLRDALHVS